MKEYFAEKKFLKKNLEIAKKINLDEPIFKSKDPSFRILNEPISIFYMGTIVLESKLEFIDELIETNKNFSLDFKIIYEKPARAIMLNISPLLFGFTSLLLTFFILVPIITFKFLFITHKK